MDIAAAADRGRVAEMRGDLLDGIDDRLLALGVAVELLELPQGLGGQVGRGPGAEILGGNVLAGDLAEVGVDVVRVDGAPLTLVVDVLEQLVSRNVAAILDDAGEAAVV